MNRKRILPALLAACMVFSLVLFAGADVYAESAGGIKIAFNGKKAVVLNSGAEPETLSQVEKKWEKRPGLRRGMRNTQATLMYGKREKHSYPSGNTVRPGAAGLAM